jgi:hypothetical protein
VQDLPRITGRSTCITSNTRTNPTPILRTQNPGSATVLLVVSVAIMLCTRSSNLLRVNLASSSTTGSGRIYRPTTTTLIDYENYYQNRN